MNEAFACNLEFFFARALKKLLKNILHIYIQLIMKLCSFMCKLLRGLYKQESINIEDDTQYRFITYVLLHIIVKLALCV
jgi:hypothetical protein